MISAPDDWPTHKGKPAFWEEVGRAVATFGFLEDMIPRFLLAFEGSKPGIDYTHDEVVAWVRSLERSLSDPLGALILKLERAFREDDRVSEETSKAVVDLLKELRSRRNALCHGAWIGFDDVGTAQLRYFVRNEDGKTVLQSEQLSKEDIAAVRRKTVSLLLKLASIAVSIGIRFPGSRLPGVDIRTEGEIALRMDSEGNL